MQVLKKAKKNKYKNITVDAAPEDAISKYEQINCFSEQHQADTLLLASDNQRTKPLRN